MADKQRVLLVDDHQLLLQGLALILKQLPNLEIAATAANGLQALEKMKQQSIDLVLTDIDMPDMDGIALTRAVRQDYPQVPVLVLTMLTDQETLAQVVAAGAKGCIFKNTEKDELATAIAEVGEGRSYFSPGINPEGQRKDQELVNLKADGVRITKRELEIMQLIAQEKGNAEIADRLFISERTVETHRKNIFKKLDTKSVVGLIKFMARNGILQ